MSLAPGLTWRAAMLPASFRGAPFVVRDHRLELGRRAAFTEFPDRDDPYVEDLGRRGRRYRVVGYVIGLQYWPARDALVAALEGEGPGTLVHPYLGRLTVQPDGCILTETQEEGDIARFEMNFFEAGAAVSPVMTPDTAGQAVTAAGNAQAALATAFAGAYVVDGFPSWVATAGAALVGTVATGLAALAAPGADLSAVAADILVLQSGAVALASDPVALAAAVGQVFQDFAIAVVAPITVVPTPGVEVNSRGVDPTVPASADPGFGLEAFGTFGQAWAAVPLSTPDRVQQAANQQAIADLVAGSAVAALGQVYANTDFASSDDASAARDTITGLIAARADEAASQGQDPLYQAWLALASASATDLTARGKALPNVITLALPGPMPALALAQRLYQDAGRAPELVQRNDAPHPLFLPPPVEALAA